MQINNLDINILYFLCSPDQSQDGRGGVRYEDVVSAFSDIPENNISAAVHSLIEEKLITTDRTQTQITITKSGAHRLQTSIACKIHQFSNCRCDSLQLWE